MITELYTIVTDIKYLLFGYCLHAVLTKKYTKHILVPTYKTFFWNLRIFMPPISLTILTMPYSVQNPKLCKLWSSQKHILIQTKIQIACVRANDKKMFTLFIYRNPISCVLCTSNTCKMIFYSISDQSTLSSISLLQTVENFLFHS